MRILAVDTTSERGSVAVVENGEILGEIRLASSIHHSERLFRSLELLFDYLDFPPAEVDLFAAASGPGSFTGLRVGLAAAKGFVAAHRKQGAGVSTLQALAWKTELCDQTIAPVVDARRGEIYAALYRRNGQELVEEQPPVVLKPGQWFSSLPRKRIVFCGDGALRYRAMIEQVPEWKTHRMSLFLATTIAELAITRHAGPLEPLYVRKSDAELARERSNEDSSDQNPKR